MSYPSGHPLRNAWHRLSGLLLSDHNLVIPLAALAVYLVSLAVNVSALMNAWYWNSDVAFYVVLAEDIPSLAGAGAVEMGFKYDFNTLWLHLATRALPFHRTLWMVGPYLGYLCMIGLIAWAARRAIARWPAIATSIILAGCGAVLLVNFMVAGYRIITWLTSAALLALLVWIAGRTTESPSRPALIVGAVTALLAGTTLASDPMFILSGIIPFAGAAAYLAAARPSRANQRTLLTAAGLTALMFVSAYTSTRWMSSLGYRAAYPGVGFSFADMGQLLANLQQFVSVILAMGNGLFLGLPLGRSSIVALVGAAITVAALVVCIKTILRTLGPSRRPQLEAHGETRGDDLPVLWVAFWALAMAASTGALVLSTLAVGFGVAAVRYAIPIFFSVAALVPIWAAGSNLRKAAVAIGAAFFVLVSSRTFAAAAAAVPPIAGQAAALASYLHEKDVDTGYASYWQAYALGWNSEPPVRVYPLQKCAPPNELLVCEFPYLYRASWYEPKDGPSFLITDPTVTLGFGSVSTEQLGQPIDSKTFGPMTVHIFPYDIASRLREELASRTFVR